VYRVYAKSQVSGVFHGLLGCRPGNTASFEVYALRLHRDLTQKKTELRKVGFGHPRCFDF